MNKRRVLYILMSLLLLANTKLVVLADNRQDEGVKLRNKYEQLQEKNKLDDEEVLNQNGLNEKYNEVKRHMIVQKSEDGEKYADHYGGAYIDGDKLVICITEDEREIYSDEDIEYKIVDYSYNDLLDVQRELEEKYVEFYANYSQKGKELEFLDSIAGIGIDEINNKVVVDIVGLTNDKKILFQEIFGCYGCMELVNVEEKAKECATYKAGRAIYVITNRTDVSITVARVSIGYRAYKKYDEGTFYGFVSCGHGIEDSVDGNVYAEFSCTTTIGTIIETRYDGAIDASFVRIINNHFMSLTTNYSNASGATTNCDVIKARSLISSLPTGYRVYKVGSTTYKTSGIIKSTNYTATVSGVSCTNMIRTTYMVEDGDSGGLLYYNDGEYNIIVGIVRGGNSSSSLYTKAYAIANTMNIYPY